MKFKVMMTSGQDDMDMLTLLGADAEVNRPYFFATVGRNQPAWKAGLMVTTNDLCVYLVSVQGYPTYEAAKAAFEACGDTLPMDDDATVYIKPPVQGRLT
jgi:hypothetical protein